MFATWMCIHFKMSVDMYTVLDMQITKLNPTSAVMYNYRSINQVNLSAMHNNYVFTKQIIWRYFTNTSN